MNMPVAIMFKRSGIVLALSLSCSTGFLVHAQESTPEAATEPAAADSSTEAAPPAVESVAEPVAAPAPIVKPRASEIAKLSSRSLLLGITQTGDKLVTVGDRGNILLSSDGKTWTQVVAPVNVTLTAVAFADANNGWAVGHDAAILHTTDAGKTWQLQNFQPELNKPLFGIFPVDVQNAYAVGAYGLFLATQDGGAHWTAVDAGPITADGLHLNSMIRLNNGDLFIAGEVGLIGVYGIDQKALAQAQAQAQARARARQNSGGSGLGSAEARDGRAGSTTGAELAAADVTLRRLAIRCAPARREGRHGLRLARQCVRHRRRLRQSMDQGRDR